MLVLDVNKNEFTIRASCEFICFSYISLAMPVILSGLTNTVYMYFYLFGRKAPIVIVVILSMDL